MPELVPAILEMLPVGAIVVTEECLIPISVSISKSIRRSFKSPLYQEEFLYSGKGPRSAARSAENFKAVFLMNIPTCSASSKPEGES